MSVEDGTAVTTEPDAERPAPAHRCLILANARAGLGRSPGARMRDGIVSAWHRLRHSHWDTHCDTAPQCLSVLAEAASLCGIDGHVEMVPEPHAIPSRVHAAEMQGYDTIVAAGGDGTVHSVCQGMIHSRLRMGIIPMGTANNVARVLQLPLNVLDAMRVVADAHCRTIDVGRVAGKYFLEAAGVGLFADAFAAFGKDEPRRHQVVRLLRVLGPMVWNPPVRNLQLTLDGEREKDAAVWIAVSNSAYIGDNFQLAPGASLEDGRFDVVIVGAMDRRELFQFAWALQRGKHLELPKVRRVRAATISLRRVHHSHRPLPVHADAEIVAYTPTLIETIPAALQVIVPRTA